MQPEIYSEDLLTIEKEFVRADSGKRFVNYLIDFVFFIVVAVGFFVGMDTLSVGSMDVFFDDSTGADLFFRVVFTILYAVFMSATEAIFKGKTLGKLVTGTRAVNLDGSPISVGTAFGRGFSRAVPFCAFSAFGTPCNPWQDKWTSTMVIDERKMKQQ